MLLTVEYNDKNEVVEIHCDKEGLDSLIEKLESLRKHGGHDHLKTPSWAGSELTEEKQGAENLLINHLYILLWPD